MYTNEGVSAFVCLCARNINKSRTNQSADVHVWMFLVLNHPNIGAFNAILRTNVYDGNNLTHMYIRSTTHKDNTILPYYTEYELYFYWVNL